jgi:hypothetical protein
MGLRMGGNLELGTPLACQQGCELGHALVLSGLKLIGRQDLPCFAFKASANGRLLSGACGHSRTTPPKVLSCSRVDRCPLMQTLVGCMCGYSKTTPKVHKAHECLFAL